MGLVKLAGLSDVVEVIVGDSGASLERLHRERGLEHIDMLFIDHIEFERDIKLCERLGLVSPGTLVTADNCVYPGQPAYWSYMTASVQERRVAFNREEDERKRGNPDLIYESRLAEGFEPSGEEDAVGISKRKAVPDEMLDSNSSRTAHVLQNVALLLLSVAFFPLTLVLVLLSLAAGRAFALLDGQNIQNSRKPFRKNVLVTGVGMTKGLTLARAFHQAGHRVIGADFEPEGALSPGRFSNALSRFYRLQKPTAKHGSAPYIQGLLDIAQSERIDLWVSCSGVASAVEDGEAKEILENRTNCKAIQFDIATTQTLHEKHTFIDKVREFGLTTPETHTITSHQQVQDALRKAPSGQKYIMKPIGMDDAARGDMTLLPKASWEETQKHINRLSISEKQSWILQQFVKGKEFCTHAVVIDGKVRVFASCPSSELLMHYEALPEGSPLNLAMLRFTQRFAANYGEGFTGHLSFDFLVEDTQQQDPEQIVLYPIECNPRAHTAVILFSGNPDMVPAYLSLLDREASTPNVVYPKRPSKYCWIGHDLVESLILPLARLLLLKTSVTKFLNDLLGFWTHVLSWKDGTYTLEDPLPLLALYHIYWPMQFLNCIRGGRRWSRLNVSTLKMFEC
ncbi:hypothetical protein PRZ48_011325 [Zasmidium cellare]|uniref:catechol O-methyltransferase n=1 Tax=Zasmidium cellare TaxID=395010 RepID=A0ABR0E629_ZASCE|nr:hypothetical protein PRZ48_011325 [Zasmidium cellare]